jgi:PBP1b-binding outer membrane lipoprotein LpoB
MNMNQRILNGRLTMACAAGLMLVGIGVGCTDTSAKRIETGGSSSIRTVGQIDDQDWAEAGEKLVASIIDQGKITGNSDGTMRRMAISRFVNNTSQNVDIDLLIKRVRIALNKTGKVVTTTTGGLGGAEDPLAAQERTKNDFETGDGNAVRRPIDYTLTGKLIENRAKAGNIRQSTFYFQMSLTDKNGDAIWEDQAEITKHGSKNSVGL